MAELTALAALFARCEAARHADSAVITYDGRAFPLLLAAPIDMEALHRPEPVAPNLSIADRMRRWNRGSFYGWYGGSALRAWIGDGRYDMNWAIDLTLGFIYCRLGVSGYCDKGWAMRSTAVLRAQEVRMLPDHREALLPYQPIEDCFVDGGCTFPEDGGWYWSVKDVTADCITLNGCGGDTYAIYRPR